MLKTKNLYHTLTIVISLALPTMFEQLMQTAVQYIDTAMVGSLGTFATAAVGSTVTVNWLVNSTVSALSVGFLSHIAQALGAKDFSKAKKLSAQAVLVCLVAGLFFTFLTLLAAPFIPTLLNVEDEIRTLSSLYFFIIYLPMLPRSASIIFGTILRASGDSKTPMISGIFSNMTNVILNFFLIFPNRNIVIGDLTLFIPGANLGVPGAAIASAIAFTFGGIYITFALYRHKVISPRGEKLRFDKNILSPTLRVAFPNMLQRFATSLGYVVFASMVNSLGALSTAAHTVANTVESLFYIPAYGMQTAASTLSGNAFGEGNKKKMADFTRVLLILEICLMTISGALLFIFAPHLVRFFSNDPLVISLSTVVLRMVAISEPIYGIAIIIEGIIQGVGDTITGLKFNILGMWVIRNAGTFICINLFNLGLISAWGCMIAHNLLLFILFSIYYKKGNWNKL